MPSYILRQGTNTAQAAISWCLTYKYGKFYFSKIAEIDKNTNITVYSASLT